MESNDEKVRFLVIDHRPKRQSIKSVKLLDPTLINLSSSGMVDIVDCIHGSRHLCGDLWAPINNVVEGVLNHEFNS